VNTKALQTSGAREEAGSTPKLEVPRTQADDLLHGGEAIASYLGLPLTTVRSLRDRRAIPVFRLGRELCARPSILDRWLDGLAGKERSA